MIQQRKTPAKAGREIAHLEDIPNIGPSIAADLRQLGITTPAELPGREKKVSGLVDLCVSLTYNHPFPCWDARILSSAYA